MIKLLMSALCRMALVNHDWIHIAGEVWQCRRCHECSRGRDPEMP